MRILLVIPSITNYFTFLDELTEELVNRGNVVGLAASPSHFQNVDCYDEKPRCEFFPLDLPQAMSPWAHFKAAQKLRKIIKDFDPGIVHCHTAAGIVTTAFCSLGDKKRRYIATHHGMVYPLLKNWRVWLIAPVERWALRQLDEVHLLNKSDKISLQEHGITNHIHLYQRSRGIGCRLQQFDPASVPDKQRVALREKLGLGRK
jgi:hypothetical protein